MYPKSCCSFIGWFLMSFGDKKESEVELRADVDFGYLVGRKW